MALTSINDVDERFIFRVNHFWWAYKIAYEWKLNPHEVKKWHAEDVMEALAAIGVAERNKPK